MKRLLSIIFLVLAAITFAESGVPPDWNQRYPNSLPHAISGEEDGQEQRTFAPTDPPNPPIRQVAEFEPMYGSLIRYPLGIPYSLVRELAEDDVLVTIVSSSYYAEAYGNYQSNEVNMANCRFLIAPSNSFWTRDFGPMFVFDQSDSMRVVNFRYNRNRPYDNEIPIAYAAFDTLGLFGMDVIHTGGNYMCDGMGTAVSTDLVLEENEELTRSQIEEYHCNYLGIETYHIMQDPLGEYIKHVDCWGKFLDVDKILIGQVAISDPRYQNFEDVASFFGQQVSPYGTPYEVFRVHTPATVTPYTPYTNSLILNKKVFVPQTGNPWDDEAISSYQSAMPGYEIIGIPYSGWYNTDALHCRVHEIPDKRMLHIRHNPVSSQQDMFSDVVIHAEIFSNSRAGLIADSLLVFYRVSEEYPYVSSIFEHVSGRNYRAIIPATENEGQVSYYLYAVDEAGKRRTIPTAGDDDPFTYSSFLIHLQAPQHPTVEVSENTAYIHWEQVSGAERYLLQFSLDNTLWFDLVETTDTSYHMQTTNDRIFYRIIALSASE